jgi:uncharacterized repeat protein (TIGR03803 family)
MDSSGNFYGTTMEGGRASCNEGYGCGTVFKLAANGTEKVLYDFVSGSDGYFPSGVVLDGAGNLYGTTPNGGVNGAGNVFEVLPDGTFKLLYSFCSQANCIDGANPQAGLIMDNSGHLYGTANDGGAYGYGTVFEFASTGSETVLHNFCSKGDCRDGALPAAGLIVDNSGNLYGTTEFGVGRDCYANQADQCGTVFKLAPNGTETALYSFCSRADCADGLTPVGSLTMDGSGKLYGTTYQGGRGHCIDGCGAVFRLDPGRNEQQAGNPE